MGGVIKFPDKLDDWAQVRQVVITAIKQMPGGTDAIGQWVLSDFEPRYRRCLDSFDGQLPKGSGFFFAAMINLEIELYIERYGGPPMQVTFEVPKPTG